MSSLGALARHAQGLHRCRALLAAAEVVLQQSGGSAWVAPPGALPHRPHRLFPAWASQADCTSLSAQHGAGLSAISLRPYVTSAPVPPAPQPSSSRAWAPEHRTHPLPREALAPNAAAAAAPPEPAAEKRQGSSLASALASAGWSQQEVLNIPNALSMARLLSGPLIASWILDAQWSLALPALALAGASDWLDGYMAKHYSRPSVVGSYLDPLADKVLVGSVVAALGWSGVLSAPMVAIILGRDVFLFTGAFAVRFKSLGWRWPGWAEFFRVAPPPPPPASPCPTPPTPAAAPLTRQQQGQAAAAASVQAAPFAEPLYISKVNTAFQLGLVGACISRAWLGWPGEEAVWYASVATATTTVWSCAAYVRAYTQGKLPLAGRV